MRYGEALRGFRVARGWSRKDLEDEIVKRAGTHHEVITEPTIKAIEIGISIFPRDTTRFMLGRVLPELLDWEHKFIPTYPVELAQSVMQRA
jgi:transcriptional regulator with XRE-family HTH domain